jgi:hypothetical protein
VSCLLTGIFSEPWDQVGGDVSNTWDLGRFGQTLGQTLLVSALSEHVRSTPEAGLLRPLPLAVT